MHDHPPRGDEPADPAVGNLPAGVTSLVGRDAQLEEFAQAVEHSRLITLTGAPGIGKSRLALELAKRLANGYRDGAYLVELAAVDAEGDVAAAIGTAVALRETPGRSGTEALLSNLRASRLLLVLDNCEHLLGRCATLATTLLAGCPQLVIVATSREPLAVEGEAVRQVPPLSLPASGERSMIESSDAVRLFVDRARAVQPAFVLNAYVAPHVAEITRRLDGLPLAIELAAALSAMLTPAEIARRLDDRFSLLTRGSRSELERHRTLEAALDWSHDLLSEPEQALLRRLSVFVEGFCLEACEAVCAHDEVEPADTFDLLAILVSRSLVIADTMNGPRSRYRLLETIRAYASDKLEHTDEAAELREAHARFYLALAEQAEPQLTRSEQCRWFARLEADRANLRSALEWSLGHARTDWALRLGGALVLYWRIRGHFTEGRDLLRATMAASNGASPDLKAKALWGVGFLTLMMGDHGGANGSLEASLAASRALGDDQAIARALMILASCRVGSEPDIALDLLEESATLAAKAGDGWCLAHARAIQGFEYTNRNEPDVARAFLDECVAVARAADDKQGLRYGLYGLGILALGLGDTRSAEAFLEQAVMLMDEIGEDYLKDDALGYLGELAFGRGDLVRATDLLDACVRRRRDADRPELLVRPLLVKAQVAREQGDLAGSRLLLDEVAALARGQAGLGLAQQLGEQALAEGDPGAARELFERALDTARAGGIPRVMGHALYCLAILDRAEGNVKRAATLHNQALLIRHEARDSAGVAMSLEAIAGLTTEGGQLEQAARLFAAAAAIREATGLRHELDPASQAHLAIIGQTLPDDELAAAWEQGSKLSAADAVALASKGRGARDRAMTGWTSLTATEQQVAQLVAEGLSNAGIAERLFVSVATVKTHLVHAFQKLGIASRMELARDFRRYVDPPPDP